MKLEIPYHLENYIGGNLIGPLSGNFIDNVNPATGEVVGQIPDSNEKDINIAVEAAKKAFTSWTEDTLITHGCIKSHWQKHSSSFAQNTTCSLKEYILPEWIRTQE